MDWHAIKINQLSFMWKKQTKRYDQYKGKTEKKENKVYN